MISKKRKGRKEIGCVALAEMGAMKNGDQAETPNDGKNVQQRPSGHGGIRGCCGAEMTLSHFLL